MYVNMLFAIHMLWVAVKPYRNLLLKQSTNALCWPLASWEYCVGKRLGTKPSWDILQKFIDEQHNHEAGVPLRKKIRNCAWQVGMDTSFFTWNYGIPLLNFIKPGWFSNKMISLQYRWVPKNFQTTNLNHQSSFSWVNGHVLKKHGEPPPFFD